MDKQPIVQYMELCSMLYGRLDGKGGLWENGYMYMYGWVPSLFTWNYHNILIGYISIQNTKLKKITVVSHLPHPNDLSHSGIVTAGRSLQLSLSKLIL